MLQRWLPILGVLAIALPLGACSKCDAAGWFNSCGGATPKAFAAVQYR